MEERNILKTCTKCARRLPLDGYGNEKKGRYGRRSICRDCASEYTRHYYQKNKDYYRAYAAANEKRIKERKHRWYLKNRERLCREGHENYLRNRDKRLLLAKIYNEQHKDEISVWQRKYAAEHREEIRVNGGRWERNNPDYIRTKNARRRAKTSQATGCYTQVEWRVLKKRYGFRCLCCDKPENEEPLTADHIVPLSKGGRNSIDNIQPLCLSCNSKKGVQAIDFRAVTKERSE